ncbi:hypothetical protein SLE2022_308350 [Rubroshorea leprosula]
MDFSSFLTSLGTSFALFVIFMLLYAWLSQRPGNAVVYYPNWILRGKDPADSRSSTRNPFAWIREVLSSREKDVIDVSGVDTAVYFVFLTTVLGILSSSGVILLPVLVPVAATDSAIIDSDNWANSTSNYSQALINGTFSRLDKLSMGNVKERSPRLWAFLIATYWVSFVTYYLLWKAYKHVAQMRAKALMSPKVKPEQFAVLVRDVPNPPEGQSKKQQVDSYFRTIYPNTFYRSLVITDNTKVNKIWKELEGCKRKLAHAEAKYAKSKKKGNTEGIRPTNKTGVHGLKIGKKLDSIDYYTEKIKELTRNLKDEQKVTVQKRQQCSALVFFKSRVTAACAGQSLHAQMVDNWTVIDAPEPQQLIWKNLTIKFFHRQTRQYVVYVIVFLTISFYLIPISFISALTTLTNLKKFLPFLIPILKIRAIETLLESYLPQLTLYLFMAVLPKFLLFLSKIEGIPSESHAIRAASGKYFYFIVVNVFIGFSIGGTVFSTIKRIQYNPINSIVTILAESLPDRATFFLTYVALHCLGGFGLELSRIIPLTKFHLKKKFYCKTEAEIRESWMPGDLNYGKRFPHDMLVITIVLCYSVMAPIIIPFGVLYFGLAWLVLRNQALKVYAPSFESYGRGWPHMHSRMLAALLLFQVTMLGYFGAKEFYYAPLAVPLVILSLIFAFVCRKKFYPAFRHTALEVVCHEQAEITDMELERIIKSYIPPCFRSEDFADDQQEVALSKV